MRLAIGLVSVALAVGVAVAIVGRGGGGSGTSPAPGSGVAGGSATAGDGGAVVWPAPADPLDRTVAAGLQPETREFLVNHVHAHLDVFVDGNPVVVPAGIGINIADPGVRRFDEPGSTAYGAITGCSTPCISPLHTHDATGIIHTESATPEPNTLGEFFIEWGVRLGDSCVGEYCSPATTIAVYVDGQPFTEDPNTILLTDQREIAIVIGTPPPQIPKTADFSRA
jgi:hypothetical protein